MSYRLVWTDRARREFDEAYLWWAQHRSVDEAQRWYDELGTAIRRIPSSPRMHSLAHDLGDEDFEVRVLLFGLRGSTTHRVLFAVEDGVDEVTIFSVRHVSQRDLTLDDLDL